MSLSSKPVKAAFVLAAGKGERLRPYTEKTPKPLLEIHGKPILFHILKKFEGLGLERVVLNAWYLKEQIVEFAKKSKIDFEFELIVSEEAELLGTGGGLKKALPLIGSAPFLMLNGDCIWKADLKKLLQASSASKASATWVLFDEQKDQTKIGVAGTELVQIGDVWKSSKKTPDHFGCFSGIQIVREMKARELPDKGCIIRNYWLQRLQEDATIDVQENSLSDWNDIGTPERYLAAR